MPVQKEDSKEFLEKLADLSVYDNPPAFNVSSFEDTAPISRQGKSGTK